jgi:3'-phosphoadenosine 5'-phosphosulfate sulfotransferase
MQWLEEMRDASDIVVASFDFIGDYVALVESLGGEPAWLRADNVRGQIDETVRKEFFQITGLPRHHALHDALALRFAYRPTFY